MKAGRSTCANCLHCTRHPYESLNGKTPVIGVAKTALRNDDWSIPLLRGVSKTPLRVTAIGMDQAEATAHIRAMSRAYRIPDMLKLADRCARAGLVL